MWHSFWSWYIEFLTARLKHTNIYVATMTFFPHFSACEILQSHDSYGTKHFPQLTRAVGNYKL